eukprot:1496424-Prymnesium_polylepis.1
MKAAAHYGTFRSSLIRQMKAVTPRPRCTYNCHVHAYVSYACVLHDRVSARKWQLALATGFSTSLCASP